jgi:protein-S-isoprenylcysteine O-methyltransferase Ste14
MASHVERRRPGAPPSLIAAAIPGAVGVVLVVFGWVAVSGEPAFDEQTVGLNLAVLGALVVLAGCGFYLWVFRTRIQRRVKALRAETLGEEDS